MKKLQLIPVIAMVLWAPAHVLPQEVQNSAFMPCDPKHIYRMDDPMLASRGFGSAATVETDPQFPGELEALQKWFDENLDFEGKADRVFVRSHIKFVVNCKGEVGDFQILSPAMPEVSEALVRAAARMPKWNAGTVNGAQVDTISRLAFTVTEGKAKVSRR